MKKILVCLTLILTFSIIFPVTAQAETAAEKEICNLIKTDARVTDAKCIVYKNNCVVAIKTEKFANKTEYDAFKGNLQKQIAEKFRIDNIVVTRNPKAMHFIAQLAKLPESKREEAIEKFIEEEMTKPPRNPQIQPR